eukprot:CAMPEP_0119513866 /NCGR_PEP_ID=MMETSP1344-20130328/31842_1 /TAXON_ID=236787 /ORGANISM="Florenciella parvula, Strain CCMP2471" /LENGTH=34 /DNA_ID= /DNA_START= /DNA_END= /DNA_ORIENTATION=
MARFYGAKGAAPREFTGITVPRWGDEDADWDWGD